MKNLFNKVIFTAIVTLACHAAFAAPPANDNLANAFVVNGFSAHLVAPNAEATKEAGEPSHAGNSGGKSIWFKWTAPSSRRMMITLARSSFDTLLAVYTGTGYNNLTLVTQNNDISNIPGFYNNRSYITFKPEQGATYLIAVDGARELLGDADSGSVRFDLAPVQSRASSDFDGDGITDISVFRPGTGEWFANRSSAPASYLYRRWGTEGDLAVAADMTAVPDGKTDFVVFRPSEGVWYIMYNLNANTSTTEAFRWGQEGDYPVTGDFLGDERTDIGVYRPSSGEFYLYDLQTGQYQIKQMGGGMIGDAPVVGDYDTDGRTDLAVFRVLTGMWLFERSAGGYAEMHFGTPGDSPVKGDYDGDGIFDLTVFRHGEGMWYTLRSTNGQMQAVKWGLNGDFIARGDYDGDGKFDRTVFRWGDGTWYTLRSDTGTFSAFNWGLAGDRPGTPIL